LAGVASKYHIIEFSDQIVPSANAHYRHKK
jgi:hypothetical protein